MADNQINVRNIALNMLAKTTFEGSFSHFMINKTFLEYDLDKTQKAFLSRLYLGTLEQVIFLDYVINTYSSINTQKMKPVILSILRMSVYQMLFMDSVPDHAAINEAVKLATKKGFGNLKGFINGVLRTIQREGIPNDIPENVRYSLPKWLYNMCIQKYGMEDAKKFFETINSSSGYTWVRLNLNKSSKEEIISMLKNDGCEVVLHDEINEAVKIKGFDSLTELAAYKKGLIFIQDISSMHIAHLAKELIGEGKACSYKTDDSLLVVDVCAAPGGKSLHVAEKFPQSFVYSRDISKNKTDLIDENIKRLKAKNVQSQIFDACVLDEMMIEKADIVIADLPCSGLGVIGQKPDIKLRVKEKDLKELASLQRNILKTIYQYVKKDGILIYSTCTINSEENEENTKWFIENHPFELILEKSFLPGIDDSDGFYIAFMKRK